MLYAVVLAVMGIVVGATFRLRFLLGMLLLVMIVSVTFARSHAHDVREAFLIIAGALIILQVGYFVGLIGRPLIGYFRLKMSGFFGAARRLQQDRDT